MFEGLHIVKSTIGTVQCLGGKKEENAVSVFFRIIFSLLVLENFHFKACSKSIVGLTNFSHICTNCNSSAG